MAARDVIQRICRDAPNFTANVAVGMPPEAAAYLNANATAAKSIWDLDNPAIKIEPGKILRSEIAKVFAGRADKTTEEMANQLGDCIEGYTGAVLAVVLAEVDKAFERHRHPSVFPMGEPIVPPDEE